MYLLRVYLHETDSILNNINFTSKTIWKLVLVENVSPQTKVYILKYIFLLYSKKVFIITNISNELPESNQCKTNLKKIIFDLGK